MPRPGLEVRSLRPELARRKARDDGLLAEVLVEAVERPVAPALRLTEPEPALPAVGIVGRRVPVVDVVGPEADGSGLDDVRNRRRQREVRPVEAALVAGDRAERRGLRAVREAWRGGG